MIAVVGGTGRLGTALVPLLHEAGRPVRVVSRTGAVPGAIEGLVAQSVRADVRRPETLGTAVDGAEVVVCAVHGLAPGDRSVSPERVDHRGAVALVDAAVTTGAAVVLLSVQGASPTGNELQRAKWHAEQHLRTQGIPWSIVRAPAYLELWRDVLARTASRDGRPVVLGTGANPVAFASVATVARAVADACLRPRHDGGVLEVPPDIVLGLADLAAAVSGPDVSPRHVPRPLVRAAGQLLRPIRPGVARMARMAVWMDTAPGAGRAGAERAAARGQGRS